MFLEHGRSVSCENGLPAAKKRALPESLWPGVQKEACPRVVGCCRVAWDGSSRGGPQDDAWNLAQGGRARTRPPRRAVCACQPRKAPSASFWPPRSAKGRGAGVMQLIRAAPRAEGTLSAPGSPAKTRSAAADPRSAKGRRYSLRLSAARRRVLLLVGAQALQGGSKRPARALLERRSFAEALTRRARAPCPRSAAA